MGIYIKGMRMPTSCRACQFAGFGGSRCELNVCMFTGDSQSTLSPERMSSCPLVPVPPHGRLIDADAIPFVESDNGCQDDYAFRYDINEMQTIIPVEEETDAGRGKCGSWGERE